MSDFIIRGSPVHKLKVAELKEELGDRGLSKSGKKDELIARLVSYLEVNGLEEEKPTNSEEGSSDSKDDMMKKWQEEREQLLRENELRRQEEEAAALKAKEAQEAQEAASKAKEAEQAAVKAKEAEEAAAKAKQAEEAAAAAKAKQAEEAAAVAKAAAQAKEAEEKRKAEEKQRAEEQKKMEEEKKLQEQKRLKAEEDKQKAEAKRLKEEQEKKANEERKAEEKRKQKEEEEKKQLREAEERKAKELKQAEEKQKEKEKSQKVVSNGKEDESLILETAADDTLVMEINQDDMVTEEAEPVKEPEAAKEPEIPTEAGQVKSLRRLGSKSGAGEERKRGWGTSKVTNGGSAPVTISSDSLKDIVPDMKPILENEAAIMETEEGETASVESDPDVAGPKVPKSVKKDKDEPVIKKKRITLTDDENETEFLLVTNLTRPFTVKSFQEMLKRTGTIEDFWIDRIKSTCCVQFSSKDQASETKMALNGVTWPVGNPKTLRVSFSTEEQMTKYKANPDGVLKPSSDRQGERVKEGVREWDKDKRPEERDAERGERGREVREVRMRERSGERKRTPPPPTKSLEELFKKTTASPAVYWKPLTEQQIQQRIELRNKKMMEAKIMREMEDTKETLQRSKKLLSGSPP